MILKEFYNRIRIHIANDYLSPVDYESMQKYPYELVRENIDRSISKLYKAKKKWDMSIILIIFVQKMLHALFSL